MKPKVQTLGGPVAREHRDGGQVKLSTFIPLKIRKRGASKAVVRPDGAVEPPGTRVRHQIALFGLERSSASIESSTYGADSQLSVVAHGSV